MSEHYFGEFEVAGWELDLLRKYDRVSLVAKYSRQICIDTYLELYAKRILYNVYSERSFRKKLHDIDMLLCILDRLVYHHEKVWLQGVKLMMGEKLSKVFQELENWAMKFPPEYYGSWPENEDKYLRAVSAGTKAIYHIDCFSDEEHEAFSKHVSEISSELTVFPVFKENKGLEYISCYVVRKGNERYIVLLEWLFNHKEHIYSEHYHWAAGVIFGYPDDSIEEYLDSRYNEQI